MLIKNWIKIKCNILYKLIQGLENGLKSMVNSLQLVQK